MLESNEENGFGKFSGCESIPDSQDQGYNLLHHCNNYFGNPECRRDYRLQRKISAPKVLQGLKGIKADRVGHLLRSGCTEVPRPEITHFSIKTQAGAG